MSPIMPSTPESDRSLQARARLVFLVSEFEGWLAKGGGTDDLVSQWQAEITNASRDYVVILQGGVPPEPDPLPPVRQRFLLIQGDQT